MANSAPRTGRKSQRARAHRVGRVSVYKPQRNSGWFGRWVDDSGTRCAQKLGGNLSRAKRRARVIDKAISDGYLGNHPDEPLKRTLASLIGEYREKLERGAKEKHISTVLGGLERAFAWMKVTRAGEVTARALEAYLDWLGSRETISESTVNHHRGYIKSFFKWAYEKDRIPRDPAKGLEPRQVVERKRRRQANSRDEIARIIQAADDGPHEYERPSVRLGYWGGMRQGEILRLRWMDLEFQTCEDCAGSGVSVGQTCEQCGGLGYGAVYKITGDRQKGKKDTINPMHPELVEYLRNYRDECGITDESATIVRNPPKCGRTLSLHRKALCLRAGIKYENLAREKCDWHSMRHSFVTLLGNNPNLHINTMRLLARHADIKTTQGYHHGDIRLQRAGLTQLRVSGSTPPKGPTSPARRAAEPDPKVVRLHGPQRAAGGAE